ncbi:tail assembly chaperone [Streptomyces phage Ididsumtinwong]|uniref:Tail assembly chaperone n=2 Tax=Austintatiousvirus ididsumtinwong TaxID=2734220 RepID=A0A1J0MC64_9CAUD|nr:tail assembly chaperone [Streptomyces phage Ididsumtinwong]APD18532.1 tail assembly chaperone [Streptomyces phage Ididsumtinwong]APD18751.1 tail assembly chaperone [Streptomyces phage Bioscum]
MTDLDVEHQEHAPKTADFDAFFAEQAEQYPRQTLALFGRTYTLPESLPILFTLQAERLQASEDPADVRRMLTALYGGDVLDEWAEHGLTDRQLGILLIWSAAAIRNPGTVSMDRAAELYAKQAAGKSTGPEPGGPAEQEEQEGREFWEAILTNWPAVEADLAREYGLDAPAVAALSTRRFLVLIGGLSPEARFARAWQRTPRRVTDPAEIAALTGNPAG